ncbi:S8 family peptidase [Butyricimonas synergistica]|uniref:S8 family peptidase n=1 Tax=Butyricimonas synergistica TaxID=544644 RepID=UPI0003712138|nr:S8 family peptidase [Butyricimonas synergistica]
MSRHDHIKLPDLADTIRYSPGQKPAGGPNIPNRDRASHAAALKDKFDRMREADSNLKSQRNALALPTRTGTYVEFKGKQNYDLVTQSLEAINAGMRLMNVRNITDIHGNIDTYATVYIPKGQENKFLNKLRDYATKVTQKGNPRNQNLINSIEDIHIALLYSFWTDSPQLFPNENYNWYEVWIKINESDDKQEQITQFNNLLTNLDISFKPNYLLFPERAVFLVYANNDTLLQILNSSDSLAELKAGKETADFWTNENPSDQNEWVEDLLRRLVINDQSNISVCVIDTGVNNGHELLSPIIQDAHCLAYNNQWTTADRKGHGTMMAGVCAYGDLSRSLEHNDRVEIKHTLCSVKLLPDVGENPIELWGDITKQCIYKAEITIPNKNILYCMAVTSADTHDKGRPSSWSAALDDMCIGASEETPRLIIVAAGNVTDEEVWNNYPDGNTQQSVHNPGQSWNSLTIGAYTEKVQINDANYNNLPRVAPSGGLSPYSSTSVLWDKKWPIKPDVVFEGGNLLKREHDLTPYVDHDALEVLTTSKNIQFRKFETINATSAACALASNLAAEIAATYPDLWAESIRALIVHSAKWSDSMLRQFHVTGRTNIKRLLRSCGYGIPNRERALYSTENGFTYISQNSLKPYIKNGSTVSLNEMHFINLPWPKELLENLGEINTTLRITLSYFIEPSPGEIGWKDKYTYQSCGLRFDVNNPQETQEQFKRRINKYIESEDADAANIDLVENDSGRWKIGMKNRSVGSIHSDMITTTAADLASCNMIAIFPVGGWWKMRTNLNRHNSRIRYSLIVSLETPATEVDLYNVVTTKIAAIVEAPIEINIPV